MATLLQFYLAKENFVLCDSYFCKKYNYLKTWYEDTVNRVFAMGF